ncbi:hypothetical protein Tco_1292071 [Tanacetum coccineum]
MADYSQKWHNEASTKNKSNNTSHGLAAIQAQQNNLGRKIKKVNERMYAAQEIRASKGAAIRNLGASIKALEIQIGQMSKEADIPSICRIKPNRYGVSSQQKDNTMQLIKLSQTSVPFLGRLKENEYDKEEVLKGFKKLQVNSAESVTSLKRLLKEKTRIEEEIKATINEHYSEIIKDDLPPKQKDLGSFTLPCLVENDKIVFKSDSPTSNIIKKVYVLGLRERMELDLEARLMGTTLILNSSQDYEFGDFLELNDLNEPLELRNHENEDLGPTIEEGEIVDEPMVDVVKIRDACVEARQFDGLITIHNGNDNVTYQMARSHPRFKHLSNEQCNKIRPLRKVSTRDKLNGISHPYQKLKSFYKGILNLGPEYIRDEKMFEWITRVHVSVHEMD